MSEVLYNPDNPDMRIVVDRPPHTKSVSFQIERKQHGRWSPESGINVSPEGARVISRALITMAAHAESVK